MQKCANTVDDLETIVIHFGNSNSPLDLRFVTMCLLSFSGFFSFNEQVTIKRSDLVFMDDCVKVNIRKSKTNQL